MKLLEMAKLQIAEAIAVKEEKKELLYDKTYPTLHWRFDKDEGVRCGMGKNDPQPPILSC